MYLYLIPFWYIDTSILALAPGEAPTEAAPWKLVLYTCGATQTQLAPHDRTQVCRPDPKSWRHATPDLVMAATPLSQIPTLSYTVTHTALLASPLAKAGVHQPAKSSTREALTMEVFTPAA